MKKRLFALLLVFLVLCNFIFIPVYASSDSDVDYDVNTYFSPYPLFTTDWGHSVLKNQYYSHLNQTDDDFYMNHMRNFNFDSTYYAINGFLERALHTDRYLPITPRGIDVVDELLYGDNQIMAADSRYKCALVDRELLLAMDNTIVHNIGQNGVRYTSLEELGLTTNNTVTTTGITVQYASQVCTFLGKSYSKDTPIFSYYDLSSVYSNTTQITIYTGGAMPPAFYIPTNCIVYQNGRALDSNSFYVILGTSELFRFALTSHYSYIGFGWFNNSDKLEDSRIIGSNTNNLSDDGGLASGWNTSVRIWSNGYAEDSTIFGSRDTNGRAWTYINLLNNLSGFMIDVDETPTTNAPDTFLPETVPYDDNDFVYVFIPVDNSNNVSYGDIIYMNPEDYDTYVNNGTIVEGDYINSYSYDTASSIIDSYNTYITNNTTNNNNTTNFDDSRIVSKLDQILQKLIEIKNKISDVSVSVESWDMPFRSIRSDLPDIFSNEPCYNNFSDCIKNSIPLIGDVQNMLNDISTVDSISINSELNTFLADSNTLNSSGGTLEDTDNSTSNSNTFSITPFFSDFEINFSWYEPYRVRIRNVLKIGVWVFCVTSFLHMVKSIFGIHSSDG